ncbi:hypothetical protein HPB50_007727 [Hyalomma asiaticum]|uniref:Uncharacterized protein n=1 Tax=Hyalomma asiaticum TaxID=266040 RepID=A0ACB7S636_HYAAI|nr:hypothetical protein HPB50_007727 [Hyalomma asiaticum]
MARSAGGEAASEAGLSKWHYALIFATPVAAGLAYWYYRKARGKGKPPGAGTGETKSSRPVDKSQTNHSRSSTDAKDPFERAKAFKNQGNKYFKEGKFDKAIDCYTEAIALCPPQNKNELATFYQNRAAAYENLKNYTAVIADCTRAIDLNFQYVKALHRRAKAYEIVNELDKCLEDITAVCILEGFQNQNSLLVTDRVLKKIGKASAKELIKAVECMDKEKYEEVIAHCTKEIENNGEAIAEALLLRGTLLMLQGLSQATVDDPQSGAPNGLRLSEGGSTIEGTLPVHSTVRVNALIKLGTLKVHAEKLEEALEDFEKAASLDPTNADVFLHRGQVLLLLDRLDDTLKAYGYTDKDKHLSSFVYLCARLIDKEIIGQVLVECNSAGNDDNDAPEAVQPTQAEVMRAAVTLSSVYGKATTRGEIQDMERSVTLRPDFPSAAAQRCYVQYRCAAAAKDASKQMEALRGFEEVQQKFPNCPECYFLHAQILSETKEFERAAENFQKAEKADPADPNVQVHLGILHLQWTQNFEKAADHMYKAISMDDKCQFAYETLGSVQVQRGFLKEGLELFEKAISLAQTEAELAHLLSLRDAAAAQGRVASRLGMAVTPGFS